MHAHGRVHASWNARSEVLGIRRREFVRVTAVALAVDEDPVAVACGAGEARIAQCEAAGLERPAGGEAVDAHDAAVGSGHLAPLRTARERIGMEAADVPHDAGKARIAHQVLQAARIPALSERCRSHVALDGGAIFGAHDEQLVLAFALSFEIPRGGDGPAGHYQHGECHERRDVAEAALRHHWRYATPSRPMPGASE